MPLFDLRLSPTEPKLPPPGQQGNSPFGGGGPPAGPKGDYKGFLAQVGVEWPDDQIVYDTDNRPELFEQAPQQIVFVSDPPNGAAQLGDDEAISGLSTVVVMYGGELKPAAGFQDAFEPLLSTSRAAGFNAFDDMVDKHPLFGLQGPIPPRSRAPITGKNHVLAARIQREGSGEGEGRDAGPQRHRAGGPRHVW